jgi:aspartyl-tRNA(Asn)/glutamyl-tRNA(Gln) amidotransferase subunit C
MIKREDVQKLASLARIRIDEAETDSIVNELDAIVGYVSEVQKVDTDSLTGEERVGLLRNVMREDENAYEDKAFTEDILAEAPQTDGKFLRVKKILS